MTQKIVHWNTHDFNGTPGAPGVIDLDPASLARTHPAIAQAIGRGRVTSHAIQYWGLGVLITLVVDED
ncbi:hypothetical protein SK854_46300 [Lentzea sp. BCCO 10_0061]|uniref:Uncharacterized protein n=1 Tax=Lentzea sokolovensis TaxID=3095429 RepID=A0ABU4VCV7_9PSEU|nr:hypothetical protein [Lentzea sp. BCCO 10_0061]MDX8149604.1 hypothetical protein [Lentzea sp. BCCO 10_0061]